MKIAVIGPIHQVGQLITKELVSRGHRVTVFSSDSTSALKAAGHVAKTVFSLTRDDLSEFDAVVNFFSQEDPELAVQNLTSAASLIHILSRLPDIRLIMMGDASLLYTDSEKQQRVKETNTEKSDDIYRHKAAALEMLKESGINWTYFAPPQHFDAQGERTGLITFGADCVIHNQNGENYISYQDFAQAFSDVVEQKEKHTGIITAVSEKKAEEPKEFPEMTSSFEGVSQYRAPAVFELAGRSVHLVMDDGPNGVITFLSGDSLYWMPDNGTGRLDYYDCLKADEDTYMVIVEAVGITPRTGVTIILDFEQSLVTVILAHTGTNPEFPLLVTNEIIFGAIRQEGKPLPRIRHGYSSDLAFSRLDWRCMAIRGHLTHVYGNTLYVRVPDPDPNDRSPMAEAFRARPYDERSHMLKIKEGLYLYSFLESNMTYNGVIGNNLVIICDIRKPHDIGRSFGTNQMGLPENYLYSGIATWKDETGPEETRQSVYRV